MQSIFSNVSFHLLGFFGQWLAFQQGWIFLLVYWGIVLAVIWTSDKGRWFKLVQTGIQSACLVILGLFLFGFLSRPW